jgi:hypothetical protein
MTTQSRVARHRQRDDIRDKRIFRVGYDTLCTMKTLFSVFLALGVCLGSLQAGPARTAKNVAKNTAITAKNVAHSVVKGTRRAVHTVVYTFAP